MAFSPDGRRLAGGGGTVWVRDWRGRSAPQLLNGHSGIVGGIAFSPDGRHVATARWDEPIRVWPAAGGPPRELTGSSGPILSLDFSPSGRRLLITDGGQIRIWVVNGQDVGLAWQVRAGAPLRAAVYSPDGLRVAETGADGTVRIRRIAEPDRSITLTSHHGPVSAVSFSPDGHLIASAGLDGTVRVRRTDGRGPVQVLRTHRGMVRNVRFSPDGRWLASTADDNTVQLWQPAAGGEPVVYHGFDSNVTDIAFASGGQSVTGDDDGTLRVWRCEVCAPLHELLPLADRRVSRELTPEERAKYGL